MTFLCFVIRKVYIKISIVTYVTQNNLSLFSYSRLSHASLRINYVFSLLLVCLCVCVWVYCMYVQVPWRPEEGIASSEAGVTVACEPNDMAAGNRTRILHESNICRQPMSHPSSSSPALLIFFEAELLILH